MTKIHFKGVDQFITKIGLMPEQLQQKTNEIVKKRTLEMEANAKNLAPVDTGHLRRSIKSDVSNNLTGIKGEVNANVEYAIYVEYGTVYQTAQPFFFPAFKKASEGFKSDIKNALGEVVK